MCFVYNSTKINTERLLYVAISALIVICTVSRTLSYISATIVELNATCTRRLKITVAIEVARVRFFDCTRQPRSPNCNNRFRVEITEIIGNFVSRVSQAKNRARRNVAHAQHTRDVENQRWNFSAENRGGVITICDDRWWKIYVKYRDDTHLCSIEEAKAEVYERVSRHGFYRKGWERRGVAPDLKFQRGYSM